MPLSRNPTPSSPKPAREKHHCVPIHGEYGRFTVNSRSAAKKGLEEAYIVDIFATEETETHGKVTGTCPCKGWSVRKTCTHLDDSREEFAQIQATKIGFNDLDQPR